MATETKQKGGTETWQERYERLSENVLFWTKSLENKNQKPKKRQVFSFFGSSRVGRRTGRRQQTSLGCIASTFVAETAALLFFFWALTWRHEEDSSEIFIVGDLQDLPSDVHQPAGHWRNPPEIQDPANHTTPGLRI